MKNLKSSIQENKNYIDYDRATPFVFETIEILHGIKYRIIHTVRRGVGDSRIVTYKIEKIGE